MDYAKHLNPSTTPQSEPLDGRQVKNNAGGFVYAVDDWQRLMRFVILGSEGNTYYVSERKMTRDNAACIDRLLKVDGPRVVRELVQVSEAGRAPKNDPAIFALALCLKHGDVATRQAAALAVPRVCRTGTHLFTLAEATKSIGPQGWGPVARRAFQRWYTEAPPDRLALQLIKYQQRNGWSHRDVLRRARPKATGTINELLHYAVKGWPGIGEDPHPDQVLQRVWAFERIKLAKTAAEAAVLIRKYELPRECVPTQFLNEPEVWTALLEKMPLHALVRNLAKMTAIGVIAPMNDAVQEVMRRLADAAAIKRSRLHPLSILLAQSIYSQGHGDKGKLTWVPVGQIIEALNEAFYLAFDSVEPTGQRRLIALDVSGSMDGGGVAGTSLTPRAAAAAMAMTTIRSEKLHHCIAFTAVGARGQNGVTVLNIPRGASLTDIVVGTQRLPFGRTDCALPMLHALEKKIPVDVFEIYTDNESWAGPVHPMVALQQYRQKMGIDAKLVAVGMTATEYSVGDPEDAGCLNVVGFDAAAPAVIADFIGASARPSQGEMNAAPSA